MQPVPRIFVSATSRDLRTARGLVAEGLRRMECLPIVQDDFPPDYKSVRDMLRTKIQDCNAVVHLAGFYHGAEPQPIIPGPDRRSFTQMEYEIAMELKLPCYVFLCGKDFPFDVHDPEPEDRQLLQLAHRDRLLKRDELFYEFATPEELANRTRELQLSVEGLRGELAKERFRRRMTLAVCLVLFLIGGGYFYTRMQKSDAVIAETTVQLQKQGDLIAQLLAEQQRIRDAASGGTAAEIITQAEVNVAKANNQTVEDLQRGVREALAEARSAVLAAGEDKPKLIAALKKLIDAEKAVGHENETIAAMEQLQKALDREVEPVEWALNTDSLLYALMQRNPGNREPVELRKEAVEWARTSPKLGEEHTVTLKLMRGLASYLPLEEKIAMDRTIARGQEKLLGPYAGETVEVIRNLAMALGDAAVSDKNEAYSEEADQLFHEVIERVTKTYGPASIEVCNMTIARNEFLVSIGKEEEAEAELKSVISRMEEKLGSMNPLLRRPLGALADFRENEEDHESAIAIRRRLVTIDEKAEGAESEETLKAKANLAVALSRSGNAEFYDEAERLQREVLDTQARVIGMGQPSVWQTMENLSICLWRKGDVAASIEVKMKRLEEMGKVIGTADIGFAKELARVGKELAGEGDEESQRAGLKLQQQCLAIRDRKLPPESLDISLSLGEVRRSLMQLEEYEQAEPIVRREIAEGEKYHMEYPKDLAQASYDMHVIMTELKRSDEALVYAKKALGYAPGDVDYQKAVDRLVGVRQPKPAAAPAPVAKEEPPSMETYTNFRKEINDKAKAGKFTTTRLDLPAEEGRRHYIEGEWNGDKMERAYESDSKDDSNGTFSFYYFNQHGTLLSIFRVQEGIDVQVDDVKKATDTYNFFGGKLVIWKSTLDDAENVADPELKGYDELGRNVLEAAVKVTTKVFNAGPKPE